MSAKQPSATSDGPGPIPQSWERVVAFASGLVAIATPLISFLVGAPTTIVIAIALGFFALLITASIFFAGRKPVLSRLSAAVAAVLIFGIVATQIQMAMDDEDDASTDPPIVVPPRLEIRAWLDKPTLERGSNGKLTYLDGNGKRDIYEKFLSPIQVRASSRANPTLLMNVPSQFNEFALGDTVIATVCGLNYTQETYKREDRRFTDQIVWDIPVNESEERNC